MLRRPQQLKRRGGVRPPLQERLRCTVRCRALAVRLSRQQPMQQPAVVPAQRSCGVLLTVHVGVTFCVGVKALG